VAIQATHGHRKAASVEAVTEGVSKGCVHHVHGRAGDVAGPVYRRVAQGDGSSGVIQVSSHSDDGAVNERRGVAGVLDPAKAYLLRTSSGAGLNKMPRCAITGGPFAAIGGILGFTDQRADGYSRTR